MSEKLKIVARETLDILNQGFYTLPSGKHVDVSIQQKHAEEASHLFNPEQGEQLVLAIKSQSTALSAQINVKNESTVDTITENASTTERIAALNFASAKNPGGGFINGSIAQEEALAYSSGLYKTQILHNTYYESNKACGSMCYTDHAIYSPDVPFFRNSDYDLLETLTTCSILTLPAVNMAQVVIKGENVNRAKTVMKNRMRISLAILAHEKNTMIILGAYGCGVFGNNPNEVAQWWKELLIDEKYERFFKQVIFTVLDRPGGSNISAFMQLFG